MRTFRNSFYFLKQVLNLHFPRYPAWISTAQKMVEPSLESNPKQYLLNTYHFAEKGAAVLQVVEDPKDKNCVLVHLSKTIFHPQGGGQPSDEGVLRKGEASYKVEDVIYDKVNDWVLHKLKKFEGFEEVFKPGEILDLQIDEAKRRMNARLHSAGHLLDVAVKEHGLSWVPGKGYHFSDGSYVEYAGEPPAKPEEVIKKLNELANSYIQETKPENRVIVNNYSHEEASKIFSVPAHLPKNSTIRYINLFDKDPGCPCGGTHVQHIGDIKGLVISKIQKKGKNVRVTYSVL